jgi:hypothetical protein
MRNAMHMSLEPNPMRRGTSWRAVVALLALFAVPGCTAPQKDSDASSYLILQTLVAAPGADPTALAAVLSSDVRTFGTAYSDPVVATFQLATKDPGVAPSPVNFITVKKYRVRYIRSDGGPVPETFEAAASFTVSDAPTSSGSLTLVRAQAKTVSPLSGLVGLGGATFLPVSAEVTFEGTDQTGKAVSVVGYIGINFADWADPGDDPTPGVASFTITPNTGLRANQAAEFNASASTAGAGRQIVSYAWNFGDGTSGSGALISHVFTAPGTYTIRMTVTDSAGQSYSAERTITVVP